MSKMKNLVGQHFGRLHVLELSHKRYKGNAVWKCQCSCNNTILEVRSCSLLSGNTKSCGCLQIERAQQENLQDVSGTIINGIKILRMSNRRSGGHAYCFAMCPKCKNKNWEITANSLKKKQTNVCRKCYLFQSTSKTATALLNKLENYLLIPIIREDQIENSFFDGAIPKLNILIESDGSFWHSLNKTKELDKNKNRLALKYGFKLIRVKNDGPNDIDKAFWEIIKTLDLNAINE